MKNEEKIQTKMMEHGMVLAFDSIIEGATVDLYRFNPSIGIKMSKVRNYADDIEQVLGVSGVRVLAPIPNTSFIGFEVPRSERTFPELPKNKDFNVAMGQTVLGDARRFDIREAPHVLVAGASGSGKSVFLSGLIRQLSEVAGIELHLFDPKMVELAIHKTDTGVVEYESDIMEIHFALERLVVEMNNRYKKMAKAGKRNVVDMEGMPYKFVVIDEFGDLIASDYVHKETIKTGHVFQSGPREGQEETTTIATNVSEMIEKNILLLSAKARASGIHIIIATQRPSVDIVKGSIKANFPVKVVFRTAKAIDSQIVLDDAGAERLAGKGDMLFVSDEGVERLQGYNV